MLLDIEVHVARVECVGARTQNRGEPAASGGPHSAEVGGFVGICLPLDEHSPSANVIATKSTANPRTWALIFAPMRRT